MADSSCSRFGLPFVDTIPNHRVSTQPGQVQARIDVGGAVLTTPLLVGGRLYVGAGDGAVHAIALPPVDAGPTVANSAV